MYRVFLAMKTSIECFSEGRQASEPKMRIQENMTTWYSSQIPGD